jgi:replication factor C subunit 3/5
MFFVDKYCPQSIKEAKFHLKLLNRLQHMSKNESIPHILLCGPEGSGKKTIIRLFLEMLFDKDVHNTEDSAYTVIGSGNKATVVTVKQSNYHIVIEPNNNNFDRYLIQDIVKEYAKKMPMSIFKTKKIFKIVLINNIDNLSYYAQTSLRRTMEKYSSTCRFIMCCTCSTRVIEPLISRCIFFNICSPTNEELFPYIYEISVKENILLKLEDYTYILDCAKNNITIR